MKYEQQQKHKYVVNSLYFFLIIIDFVNISTRITCLFKELSGSNNKNKNPHTKKKQHQKRFVSIFIPSLSFGLIPSDAKEV